MSKGKKILIGITVPIVALLLAFAILCFVTMGMYSSEYLNRVISRIDSDIEDYKYFPSRPIAASENVYEYAYELNALLPEYVVEYNGKSRSSILDSFVDGTKTTAFIVIKNDKIVYERYANGYDAMSINTSFSMSKSVVSLLIGKAIEDGYIKAVDNYIGAYIEEFEGLPIGEITIEDLLLMRSPIEYSEDKFLWFGDDSLTYWHPDLRKIALEHTKLTDKYQGKFHYNNYHPLLLGIILERSTGMSVAEYFEKSIWQPIGAQYDASWSLDSEKSGFEKMESGLNFRAVDFAKIGSMVLLGGNWNGEQIISRDWLNTSTLCEFPIDNAEYSGTFLGGRNVGYKYMWYSCPSPKGGYDMFAWGKSDQILYISPDNDTVILRNGKSDGGVSDWEAVLQAIANADCL
ncbi:MAG: beta-lactamase family protein [Clostridia bacterium]|nr:beta-lactamase family protein [Clostridia bacterium]